MEKEVFAVIGVIFTFAGYSAYIVSIFRGNTKPHPFSWFTWSTLTAIGYFAQISDNAGLGAWVMGLSALISYFITILAYIKRRQIIITKSDWVTFIACMAAIPLWLITDTAFWSVIWITFIDLLACYPTFRKTWFHPNDELPFEYYMAALKFVLSLFALNNYTVITVLYPLSLVIINSAFLIMQFYRKQVLSHGK